MDSLPSYLDEDATSSEKMMRYYGNNGRRGSADGYTAGSTTPSSSNSRSVTTPPSEGPLFPSPEVLESAMWTSSEYSSSESFSYDDDEDDPDGSEYSSGSYSGSGSDDDGFSDDGTANYMRNMMRRSPPGPESKSIGRPAILGGLAPKTAMPSAPMGVLEGLPFGGAEGLPFTLESLKRDLEKVGRVIISSNVGEVAAERAHTLASINWLASHVPNAVLDKLGHEIKDMLERGEEVEEDLDGHSKEGGVAVEQMTDVGCCDSMSEVSDLSHLEDVSSDEDEEETMELVDPADASNEQICYGDLAAFERTRASSFFPDEQLNGSQAGPSAAACGPSNSCGKGILDLIPVKKTTRISVDATLTSNNPNSRVPAKPTFGNPEKNLSMIEAAVPAQSAKSSKITGMKGLFRRFSKKGRNDASSDLSGDVSLQNSLVKEEHGLEQSNIGEATRKDVIGTIDDAPSLHSSLRPSLTQKQTVANKRSLPYSSKYRCALLLVDISGFTKLSRLLDPESLSKVRID